MTKKEIEKIQEQLSHIENSIQDFYIIIHNLDKESFINDIKTQFACIHAIYCIQESIYQIQKIHKDIRTLYPTIEWAKIIKLRTDIAHEYFQLHIDTLWQTVIADIPRLDREIPLFKAFIKKLQKGLIPNTSPKR